MQREFHFLSRDFFYKVGLLSKELVEKFQLKKYVKRRRKDCHLSTLHVDNGLIYRFHNDAKFVLSDAK